MQATTLFETNASRKRSRSDNTANNNPVICLSGFCTEEKNKYHAWIELLGGRYTRQLDTEQNTHLIAKEAEGDKYEAALASPSKVQVVRHIWIEECFRKKDWIPVRPKDHGHPTTTSGGSSSNSEKQQQQQLLGGDASASVTTITKTTTSTANPPPVPSLPELLREVWPLDTPLVGPDVRFTLFSPCQLVLVGFDEQHSAEYVSLCQIIRLGMGRVAWTVNERITHVVIPDGSCDETVRDAAILMQCEHPNAPDIVSPRWIIQCWKEKKLLDPSGWEPEFLAREDTKAAKLQKLETTKNKNTMADFLGTTSNLFRNCLFTLLRVAPPSWAVDYDTHAMEELIQSNGGQILTTRVVEALLIDHHATATTSVKKTKRKCFVVCWGGDVDSNLTMHATLGQVRHLVDVIPVTPTWLHTCRSENKLVSRSRCRSIFQPTPWPTWRLVASSSLSLKDQPRIRVSISGFSGSLRSGLVHWITAMGGGVDIYDDALDDHTTHVVCASPNSEKYIKAKKRGLYVVSLDWIFHIAQYGYHGKSGGKDGCEGWFPVETKETL